MKIIRNIDEIPKSEKLGLTVGNFDGVHLGHQFLLKTLKDKCARKSEKLLVISFKPHPQTILGSIDHNFLISDYEQKRNLLDKQQIDYFWEIDFNRDFSTLKPEEFLDNFILKHNGVNSLYLGHDFVFGAHKSGDFNFAKKHCEKFKINVELLESFKTNVVVSSSKIRKLLNDGYIDDANELLGHDFLLCGLVVKGEGRGKKIGFPTANIQIDPLLIVPKRGVYITTTNYQDMTYHSITNIGFNPTFENKSDLNVETHILDFDSNIYGEEIQVTFHRRIRDERKFQSANDLIEQIKNDIEVARKFHEK